MQRLIFGVWISVSVLLGASGAAAQGGSTATLSGVVVDSNGGVIPGAAVVVKNVGTNTTYEAVSGGDGAFSVPALGAGNYSITVTLNGFKTAVLNDVRLVPGVPASVKAVLDVGALTETVTVSGASDIVNTQTATISATLNVDEINKMPLPTRNAINAVTFLPGVNTATTNRESNFNGLPDSFVAITLDGVNNNDNFNKSTEGLFAMVTPRQDAVEAVTVTTAVGGADVGGSGAVQLSFVTRSGTNRFTGSAYEYFRSPELNTNYWFNKVNNLPKNDVTLNQYGFRQGGPIVVPGLFNGRDKAFFFVNYEELRLPNNFSRTRTVLAPSAQAGVFSYTTATGVRQVNVLDLAARNGQITALDPLVMRTLGAINTAMTTTGTIKETSDPLLLNYVWQSPGNQREYQPVFRLDYNLSAKHRLTGTGNWQKVVRDPDHLNGGDIRFPGASNYQRYVSTRPIYSTSLRSTLGASVVNELRGGITRGGASYFGEPASNGPQTFADLDGYALDFDQNLGLTNWFVANGPTSRSAWSWNIDDTVSLQKGRHSLSIGGSLYFGRAWENGQQIVPGIQLGLDQTSDPAAAMFSTANFPGASTAQLTDARELYGLLTGRVTSVTGQAALDAQTGQYVAFGQRRRAGNMNEHSLFVQDSWRLMPTLTLNGGLRWDVQLPFTPVNDIMSQVSFASACGVSGFDTDGGCRFFAPGASGGVTPEYVQFTKGSQGWNTDWNNLAPNISAAWRPNVQSGLLRRLLGDPDQATLRAGYSIAYDRQGMGVFTGQFGANPGTTLSLTRNANTGLVPAGESWPVLLSQTSRLYNAPFPATPTYPIALRANRADSLELFAPDIEVASAHSWTVSFQRALSKNTAVDIRYVGTRGVNQWTEVNYNERNIIENGFIDEFRLAMRNLQANNASGIAARSGSFAYFGSGTGTSPLPIYLAYLNGSAQASSAAAYTGTGWTNSTIAGRLVAPSPDPQGAAQTDLDGDATRRANALAAGLPANFFVLNPAANNVNVYESAAYSDYHALQIELRRRLSRGLQVNGSYQYALEGGSSLLGLHFGRRLEPTANVRHALKTQWTYSVPVGRGQRFGSNLNPVLEAVVGGWEFNGNGRVQARTVNIIGPNTSQTPTNRNVRLVGMSVDELTKEYHFRIGTDPTTGLTVVSMLPEDIILNTRRAFSTSTTSATGYSDLGVPEGRYIAPANSADCIELKNGDCAPGTLLVRAPIFTRFDMGLGKRFPLGGSANFEFRVDVLNVFNNINFDPAATAGPGATIFQTTSAYTDNNNTFDPGGRLGMLVFRVNW
jgi:carboxypeptidase family protein